MVVLVTAPADSLTTGMHGNCLDSRGWQTQSAHISCTDIGTSCSNVAIAGLVDSGVREQ